MEIMEHTGLFFVMKLFFKLHNQDAALFCRNYEKQSSHFKAFVPINIFAPTFVGPPWVNPGAASPI